MQKQLEIVKWHILKYSKDLQAQELYRYRLTLDRNRHFGRGNRTSPCLTLENLERSRELDRISGLGQRGHRGLGLHLQYRRVEPRKEIIDRLKKEAEEKRMTVLHSYQMQTAWLSWGLDRMMYSDLSWKAILHQYTDRLLKFLINVLFLIAVAVQEFLRTLNARPDTKDQKQLIRFIPAGQQPPRSCSSTRNGILALANDWSCDFDLPELRSPGSRYVFPHEVCATPLKIDGHLVSRKAKICIGLELTCPMEENIADWHQAKLAKYEDEIQADAQANGWKFYAIILEVGARGWIPTTVVSALKFLGLPSAKELCDKLTHTALKSSYVIWLNRWNKDFKPWRLASDKEQATLGQHKRKSSRLVPLKRAKLSFSSPPISSMHSSQAKSEAKSSVGKFVAATAQATGSAVEDFKLMKQPSLPMDAKPVVYERKVLVDGKWLREGKASDFQPRAPPAPNGVLIDAGAADAVDSDILKVVPIEKDQQIYGAVAVDPQTPDDFDVKELIKIVTFDSDLLSRDDSGAKEQSKIVTPCNQSDPVSLPAAPAPAAPGEVRIPRIALISVSPASSAALVKQSGPVPQRSTSKALSKPAMQQGALKGQSSLKAPSKCSQQMSRHVHPPSVMPLKSTFSAPRQATPRVPSIRALEASSLRTPSVPSKAAVLNAQALPTCLFCKRRFSTQIGVSVHAKRWCKLRPKVPGDAVSLDLQGASPRRSDRPVLKVRPQSAPARPRQSVQKPLSLKTQTVPLKSASEARRQSAPTSTVFLRQTLQGRASKPSPVLQRRDRKDSVPSAVRSTGARKRF